MRWLSNVRLPQARRCRHGDSGLWRIGLEADEASGSELITAIEPIAAGGAAAGTSWDGDWLSPMGVDLQINGGLGLAFPELTPADLPRLAELQQLLWRDGVEAICPTLVTCGIEPLRQALAVLAQARAEQAPNRCRLLGAHLEGPFLAHGRRGAHPEQHLAAPSAEALHARIDGFTGGATGDIALMTLAPELEGAAEVIAALRRLGVVVSLGHSAASETEAAAAFGTGVALVTHAFNAMPGLHHRQPGPLAAALLRGDVALGLIADGVHVAPSMAVLLQRLAPEQVVLVSDALAPYGLGEGQHRWDERLLIVADGSCRLADGTLAGVTLPLLEGARRLAAWSGEPGRAIAAATVLPRQVLGDQRSIAALLLGRPLGHCLRWSAEREGLSWRTAAQA
ncbi:MAG: amidohydrolase family protein [Cyanobacteria bacterium K_DeepCast_35m_m2_023]|nr:amidohydrolase family protein [Cyanobacteria bacterium K_DeepCast_35m_m2_023]